MLDNTLLKSISSKNCAHELLERLNLETDVNGNVKGIDAAFLLQKLITCIKESRSLNDTFEKLLTTESIDFQEEAECAIALNSVVGQHIDNLIDNKSDNKLTIQNSNELVMSIAKEKLNKNNINEVSPEINSEHIQNITCLSEFRKRKSKNIH